MAPQQSPYERYKAMKQQPAAKPLTPYEQYKAKVKQQTPNPPPTSPTEKPGFLSRAWDASRDLAEGFAGQLYMGMNPGGAGSIAMGQGLAEPWVEAYQDTTRDPRARFGRAASKMIGLNPDAIEEDWNAGNYGGVAGGIAPALVAGAIAHKVGGGLRAKAAGNVGKLAYDPNVRLPSQPYDVPYPPSPYDVPYAQSPWPNEKVPPKPQPFDVERPPSPYNVPLPPPPPPPPPAGSRLLPERAGMGTQDLYPRGPRTAPTPLLGLGEGTPVRETPFRAGPSGGQPVTNLNDPSNIDIFGQSIDPSITAQNTVRNPPVQPGFNPALGRPGTSMPLERPLVYAPPPVEPVVAPTPAKAGKVGRRPKNAITPDAVSPEVLAADEAIPEFTKPVKAKVVQPVKPPKPIPIGKYTDDMLIERVKLGTATPEIQAEIAKRIAKKEKAAAAAPIVQQPTQPTTTVVEPPVVQPPVRTLPKVEPVAVPDLTPAPDVTPVGTPVEPPVAPPKAKDKPVTVPKSVINRLDRALAEAKTVYKEALKDVKGYRSPMKDESMDPKWNEFNDKLNAARKALTAATKAKVKAVSISEPVIEPVVKPVKAAPTRPTLPKVEPIQGLDLSGHTREQLIELARTADDATSLTIRQELKTRREAASRKAGTDLPSGLGSFQDMPRLLKQEFDDWRVLKNLPENQATYERFIQETGRASKMYARYASRPAEQKLPPVEPVEIPKRELPPVEPIEEPVKKPIPFEETKEKLETKAETEAFRKGTLDENLARLQKTPPGVRGETFVEFLKRYDDVSVETFNRLPGDIRNGFLAMYKESQDAIGGRTSKAGNLEYSELPKKADVTPFEKPIVPDVDQSVLKKEEPEFDSTDPDWSPDLSRYSDRQFKDYYEAAMRDKELTPAVAKAAKAEAERRANVAATEAAKAARDKPTGNAAETWKTLSPGPLGEYGRTFIRRMKSDVTKTLGHGDPLTRERAYAKNPEFFSEKLAPYRVWQVIEDIKGAMKTIKRNMGFETVPGQHAEMERAFDWGRNFIAKLEDPNVSMDQKYFDIIDEIHEPNRKGDFTDPFYDYDKMLEEMRAEEAVKRVPDVETEKPSLRGMPLLEEAEGFKTGDRVKTKDAHGNPVEGIVQRIIRSQTIPWLDVYIPDKRVGYQGFNRRIAPSEALKIDREVGGWIPQEFRREGPSKPTEQPLPKVEPVDSGPLSKLTTEELADAAKVADSPEEVAAIRKEVARRRNERGGRGTSIPSGLGALTDAGPILKKEFDQWRVLKELPENQEAFDQFLKDTGKAGRIVLKGDKLEEQKWQGPAKNVKISTASIPDVDIPKEEIPEFGSRASKTLGKLDYPDMPTAARRVGRTISDVDLGEESRFGKRGTGREIPEAKPPVLTERFQQGIVDPKREDLKGLSVREIAAKAGKEADELAKREAAQAAIERGKQEAIEDRKRAKITAQIVRREDRLRERKKKIDEKKAKVAEKKAVKKAAEIPPADVTETGRGLFGGNRKFMSKNLPFKEIMDKFVSHRSAGQPIVKSVTDKFKNIKKFTKKQVVEFQDAVEAGQYPAVRKFYDDLHDRLTSQGIELGKKENYLPQLWENTPAEVKAAFGDKQMNSKASFQHRSYIEDYRTGIERGLKPKLSPLEQMTWYAERANKLEADHAALKALKAKGYLIKVGELKPGSGMKELDSSLGAFKGYAAHPEVKHVIENYLKQADFGSGFAKATGKLANLRLSSGVVPFTPIMTAHGGNIARPFFSRSFAEGGVRRNLKALKYGFNPRAAERYLVSKGDQIVADTQEFGYSSNVSEPAGTQGNYFEGEKPGRIKRGLNWLSRGQYKAFERNLFEKMLPAIKHEAFTDNMKQFQKQGMSRAKAGKAAVDVTDHFYSGKNIDLLYNNKHFNNVARILTLAPGWLRSSVDLGIQIPKSFAQAVTKEGRNSPIAKKYRSAGYNLLGTYVAANIAQKMVHGKFMVENEPSEIFTFQAGETSDGKTRGVDLYGSAFDFGEIPAKMAAAALGGEKSKSLGEVASRSIQYKASPPIQALIDFSKGTDFRGETNLAGTTDRFGNYIPTSQRAKNTLSQVINFGPPQVANPINYFSGRAGLEESIARIAEMNLTYKHKKKVKQAPMSGPGLAGLEFSTTPRRR